jgi:D-glycero-alpha-D-manno-heptose-7-phosphate kinase
MLRAIVEHFGIERSLSVFLTSELPPHTGLGISSAGNVALIKGVAEMHGVALGREEIADLACRIEVDKFDKPVGKQDVYASCFGGLNYLEFSEASVTVEPIVLAPDLLGELERRLMLFFSGRFQDASEALDEQRRGSQRNRASVIEALHEIKGAAIGLNRDLRRGDIDSVGGWFDVSWASSRQLARGIADPWVDEWYALARSAGASGGKTAGLGSPGFLLLYCQPQYQQRVTDSLQDAGLKRLDFRLEHEGANVVLQEATRAEWPDPVIPRSR